MIARREGGWGFPYKSDGGDHWKLLKEPLNTAIKRYHNINFIFFMGVAQIHFDPLGPSYLVNLSLKWLKWIAEGTTPLQKIITMRIKMHPPQPITVIDSNHHH